MHNYALVVIGYNRIACMKRLLQSLSRADYGEDSVTLIISIDNNGSNAVEQFSKDFVWAHGEKRIRTFPTRQGLRRHILSCGQFLREFDAIAVFEDDLIAAPGFYQFMKTSVDFYQDDDGIAGISLYNHLWNVNACYNFIPEPSLYDVYFIQFAQSWGQIWMSKQWFAFEEWYKEHNGEVPCCSKIPRQISKWPSNSWLKYHIWYCIAENKFFVYPYQGYTTCFEDVGEHSIASSTKLQIPLSGFSQSEFRYCTLDQALVKYDAFFERMDLAAHLGIMEETLCVDLYSTKQWDTKWRYLLTMQALPYRVIRSFALQLKPQELNILWDLPGKDIFFYDTYIQATKPNVKDLGVSRFLYYQKAYFHVKDVALLLFQTILKKMRLR